MDLALAYAEIVKSSKQPDGTLLVHGKATGSDLDLDQQRCDAAWLNRAMPEWFRSAGNIREQHDPKRAAGKATEHEAAEDGHYITARIVDPVAKAKCEAGVYTGFSIGVKDPMISKSADAPGGVINGGQIVEISLVDRPCLPTATLTLVKAAEPGWSGSPADLDEERGLVRCEDIAEGAEVAKTVAAELGKSATPTDTGTGAADGAPADTAPADTTGGDAADKTATPATPAPAEFDADTAKALVADVLKADAATDIADAKRAIEIIGGLIASEASDLSTNPSQTYDIRLLLDAVTALRAFIHCEQSEARSDYLGMAADADAEAAAADLQKGKYSAEQLRNMLAKGQAIKNADGEPSYPIADEDDLRKAIRAIGRGSRPHDELRRYIIKRAKALGKADLIPDNWTSSGASKTTDTDTTPGAAPDATKATVTDGGGTPSAPTPDLVKALTDALGEDDHPLRKMFVSITEDSATAAAKAVSDELTARLDKVEQMATPGGPALRRPEAAAKNARVEDLTAQVSRYRALEERADDQLLRLGYARKAAELETELKTLL